MKIFWLAILILSSLATLGIADLALADNHFSDDFQKGINFPTWWHDKYLWDATGESLEKLAETGANWVVIDITWFQKNASASEVYQNNSRTPSDKAVKHIIEKAHGLGLKVMIKLFMLGEDNTWAGKMQPSDQNKWFASYKKYVEKYAGLAKETNAEMLAIGTEMEKVSVIKPDKWQEIIQSARGLYQGPITYSANWTEYKNAVFWDELDYIGINAYFPLTNKDQATVEEMISGWTEYRGSNWFNEIKTVHEKYNKPAIFTEVGYMSAVGNTRWPWVYSSQVDLDEQSRGIEALFSFWSKVDWLKGIHLWYWDENSNSGGSKDSFNNLQNKPVVDVIKDFWKIEAESIIPEPVEATPPEPEAPAPLLPEPPALPVEPPVESTPATPPPAPEPEEPEPTPAPVSPAPAPQPAPQPPAPVAPSAPVSAPASPAINPAGPSTIAPKEEIKPGPAVSYAIPSGIQQTSGLSIFDQPSQLPKENKLLSLISDIASKLWIFGEPSTETKTLSLFQKLFVYGRPRVSDLMIEQDRAKELKTGLQKYFSYGVPLNAKHWPQMVNAYVYGGYPVEAIVQAIKFGGKTVHPTIAWSAWQNSKDYQSYINR